MTGEWPKTFIDHIDGNRSNNRFENLRLASKAENGQNRRGPTIRNKTGFLGVTKRPNGKFHSAIRINGVQVHLGDWMTPEEAHEQYLNMKRIYHGHNTL